MSQQYQMGAQNNMAAAAAQAQMQQEMKNPGVAMILVLFLGLTGAQWFYLGRIGKGFAYLFTLGFLGVGAIIDIFTIMRKTREHNAQVALKYAGR